MAGERAAANSRPCDDPGAVMASAFASAAVTWLRENPGFGLNRPREPTRSQLVVARLSLSVGVEGVIRGQSPLLGDRSPPKILTSPPLAHITHNAYTHG
jgi:hypothetical protein